MVITKYNFILKSFYVILALKYDRMAVNRLVQILTECQNALSPGHTLWVAMQSNTMMDVGQGYPMKWADYINEAKQSRKQDLSCAGFINAYEYCRYSMLEYA